MKLSTSQRVFLERATAQYESQIHIAEEYLVHRGLNSEEVKRFRLGVVSDPLPGHEQYKDRLAIPYVTPSGVVDIRFRTIKSEDPKYLGLVGSKTTLYNVNDLFRANKYVCVCEGEIDTITVNVRTKHPTIGVPGANNWKPHYTRILSDFETIIVLADGDQAGAEFGRKIGRELSNVHIVQMPDEYDVNSLVAERGAGYIDEKIERCFS